MNVEVGEDHKCSRGWWSSMAIGFVKRLPDASDARGLGLANVTISILRWG
jgi:hypothetical protein